MDGQSRGLRAVIRHEVFPCVFAFRLMWRTRARHQLGLSFGVVRDGVLPGAAQQAKIKYQLDGIVSGG